jgi:hypothetical protein
MTGADLKALTIHFHNLSPRFTQEIDPDLIAWVRALEQVFTVAYR